MTDEQLYLLAWVNYYADLAEDFSGAARLHVQWAKDHRGWRKDNKNSWIFHDRFASKFEVSSVRLAANGERYSALAGEHFKMLTSSV